MGDLPSETFPQNSPIYREAGFLSTKTPSSIAFICCLLLFLLPMLQIRQGKGLLQKLNGVSLATGFTVSLAAYNSNKELESPEAKLPVSDKRDPNIYALVALGLGIMGLFLSIVNARPDGIGGILAGTLAAGALIGMWLTKDEIVFNATDDATVSVDEAMVPAFTPWYYLLILCFLLAAFCSYKRIVLNR